MGQNELLDECCKILPSIGSLVSAAESYAEPFATVLFAPAFDAMMSFSD